MRFIIYIVLFISLIININLINKNIVFKIKLNNIEKKLNGQTILKLINQERLKLLEIERVKKLKYQSQFRGDVIWVIQK